MFKIIVKLMLNCILFLSVFLFAHTYFKNVSVACYLLIVTPILLIGMFGIDAALSLVMKKED